MIFDNKRILILCKETSSYPLYFLTKKWIKNNRVAAFFFMPCECKYSKCLLNNTTYYQYLKLNKLKVYDVCDIADDFSKNLKNPIVNWDYINEIEKNYTYFKNLNCQLLSSQLTSRQYHNRNYFSYCTYEQQVYWLELNYKRIIQILDDFSPDVIIDYDDAELPRTIINEVAHFRNIPYITIDHPRYDFYKLYTYQMGIGLDDYFSKRYKQNLNKNNSDLNEEIEYVLDFRSKSNIMPDEYKNTITSQYTCDSLLKTIKSLWGKISYFREQDRAGDNRRLKKNNKIIYPNSGRYVSFYFRVEFRKRKLYKKNKFFSDPVKNEEYVYMPLHLIPESTTFVKAPMYVNELNIIEAVSKSLPIGWKLYVKEHQAMLGERSLEFYKRINQLPNVRLVSINYYKDPKPWLINSKGVITITGTSAYEAAMLGKKAIVFGDVPFILIDGIERVQSFEMLPNLIKDFSNIDNIHSCATYIATVKEVGVNIKYKYLMQEGENILFNRTTYSETYEVELNKLEEMYLKAYSEYVR